jgi:hypothetical protein
MLLPLAACGVQAQPLSDEVTDPPGTAYAAEPATERPAALADLPYYAGIAGNDAVHREALDSILRKVIRARDFDTLNAIETHFRTSRSRLPGGTWELDTFHRAVGGYLQKRPFADSPCGPNGIDFTEAWARHDPTQPGAYITEAKLRVSYAWCVRSRDRSLRARTTSDEYVEDAYRLLVDHAAVAKRDPQFYAVMADIYTAQGRRGAVFQNLLDEGTSRFPYYYGIYFEASEHEMPQYGGSFEDVEKVARYAAERTRAEDGDGAYARVVWYFMECGCDPDELPIDRARLARGMDDLFERYPSGWNVAHFAQIACKLGEPGLAAKQFARGGGDGTYWDYPDELQRCREFAGLSGTPLARR